MAEYIEREAAVNAVLNLVPKVDCDGYCWVIRGDAARAIDTIPAADVRPVEWIPVTERLPEDIDEEVLVCTEDYGVSGLGFVTVATYGANGWLECWERKTYLTAVTHWIPLPGTEGLNEA